MLLQRRYMKSRKDVQARMFSATTCRNNIPRRAMQNVTSRQRYQKR